MTENNNSTHPFRTSHPKHYTKVNKYVLNKEKAYYLFRFPSPSLVCAIVYLACIITLSFIVPSEVNLIKIFIMIMILFLIPTFIALKSSYECKEVEEEVK